MQNKLLKNKPSNYQSVGYSPIGVMDSGVGGLSVLRHIHRLLPYENLSYVADSQYAPYGTLSPEKIIERCFTVADFLIAQGIKVLVVACNTATASAITDMRGKYDLPIIGMEPAVKPAAAASKNGIIGVLATVGTLKSAQFAALLESYGRNVDVVTQGCIGLVECIERGETNLDSTKALLTKYCKPLLEARADTIVLGCTHYPFVRELIQHIVGDEVTLIDTGAAVASHLQTTLQSQSLINSSKEEPAITIWTNSSAEDRESVIQQLWGNNNIEIRVID